MMDVNAIVSIVRNFNQYAVKILMLSFSMLYTAAQAETAKVVTKPAVIDAKQPVMAGESVLSVVLSLILVVAIIFLLAWAMRRMGGTAFKSHSFLKILGGVSMGARERIVLVQVGDEQILLGVAPGRIQTLHKLDKPLQGTESRDFSGVSFAERLKTLVSKEK